MPPRTMTSALLYLATGCVFLLSRDPLIKWESFFLFLLFATWAGCHYANSRLCCLFNSIGSLLGVALFAATDMLTQHYTEGFALFLLYIVEQCLFKWLVREGHKN